MARLQARRRYERRDVYAGGAEKAEAGELEMYALWIRGRERRELARSDMPTLWVGLL